jgi:hypothetical protein
MLESRATALSAAQAALPFFSARLAPPSHQFLLILDFHIDSNFQRFTS